MKKYTHTQTNKKQADVRRWSSGPAVLTTTRRQCRPSQTRSSWPSRRASCSGTAPVYLPLSALSFPSLAPCRYFCISVPVCLSLPPSLSFVHNSFSRFLPLSPPLCPAPTSSPLLSFPRLSRPLHTNPWHGETWLFVCGSHVWSVTPCTEQSFLYSPCGWRVRTRCSLLQGASHACRRPPATLLHRSRACLRVGLVQLHDGPRSKLGGGTCAGTHRTPLYFPLHFVLLHSN